MNRKDAGMTNNLDRVLADIDFLLPPGAPSVPAGVEPWEAEAMRWSPVDHDDHPDIPAPPQPGDYRTGAVSPAQWLAPAIAARRPASLSLFQQQTTWVTEPTPPVGQGVPDRVGVVIERSGWYILTWPGLESAARAAAENESVAYRASLEQLGLTAQHTTTHLQHLRDRINQAQAAIDARRHRNTGPANPRGIDGRARRHQHPTRAPACNARPATQGAATQGEAVRAWLQSGPRFIVGRGPHPDVVWVDEPWDVGL